MKGEILLLFALLTFSIFSIAPITAWQITTDDISKTSIVWNVSARGEETYIVQVVLDGVLLDNYAPNTTRIVQSGLEPNELHTIAVTDSNFEIAEMEAYTDGEPMEEEETGFFTLINLYVLIFISLVFVVSAIFTRVYFLSFIGTLFAFIGLIGSIGNNFITGLIFGIMFIITLFVGFNT